MHQSSNESQSPAAAAANTQSSSLATAPVTTLPDATQSSSLLASGGSKSSEAPAVADCEDVAESALPSASEMSLEERKERWISVGIY